MTDLYIYNSLTRTKEKFTPLDAQNVRLYVCGPTVYSYAHIGNARAAVVFDVLRRVLDHKYQKAVTHVSNITDIDDKIMDAAQKSGEPIHTITKKYTDIYNADMGALGVQKPHVQPHATEHVGDMVDMIQSLIDTDHAYAVDGHVLFHVPAYPEYGALSGRNRDEQIAGARVEVAPFKKDPADFVLWKPSNDDQPGWDSPWGRGRPGWHIECSVMVKHHLGETFDIHGGGLDLTFPHHENEIAQSCCANKTDHMAKYWMHNGFLMVEGEKMSKSIGNVLLVHDMIEQGISGEAIRLTLLSTHYRQPLNWTAMGLDQSMKTLDKWYKLIDETPQDHDLDYAEEYIGALYNDLNTPQAISVMHAIAKDSPHRLKKCGEILGILQQNPQEWRESRKVNADISAEEIDQLVKQRDEARANKDFAKSDEIRDTLLAKGVIIKDSADGATWDWA